MKYPNVAIYNSAICRSVDRADPLETDYKSICHTIFIYYILYMI